MRKPRLRLLTALGVASLALAPSAHLASPAGAGTPRVLLVGTFKGVTGAFATIQAAVDSAQPGDWVLVGPGHYHENGSEPAGVLITKPGVHLRGMDRNLVVVDGTLASATASCGPSPQDQSLSPAGRNGIEVSKADGVSIENLTVCNFLSSVDGHRGNQVWWNGGDGSGLIGMGPWSGSYLTATSTYFQDSASPMAQYGLFVSNAKGPGTLTNSYASNMGDSAYYVGACPDCNAVLDHVHAQHSALGFSGTNAGGHLRIQNSEWDGNRTGIVPNSLNNDDAPSPQNGACPSTPATSCTVITGNNVHDNNDPNVPAFGIAAAGPVGAGIEISGGQNDTVVDNTVDHQGSWGVVINDFPDTSTPPPVANCKGGIQLPGVCEFQAFGNEVAGNQLSGNGFFGNPTNGDLAAATSLHNPGNCFHDNVDAAGLTSDPPAIETVMGKPCGRPNAGDTGPLAAELTCASEVFGQCPDAPGARYPRTTTVTMLRLPLDLPSMPDPCLGVPQNPWCPVP